MIGIKFFHINSYFHFFSSDSVIGSRGGFSAFLFIRLSTAGASFPEWSERCSRRVRRDLLRRRCCEWPLPAAVLPFLKIDQAGTHSRSLQNIQVIRNGSGGWEDTKTPVGTHGEFGLSGKGSMLLCVAVAMRFHILYHLRNWYPQEKKVNLPKYIWTSLLCSVKFSPQKTAFLKEKEESM